jgi:phosphonate transport system permease protein
MDESLKMMAGNEVASMLIIFVLLVGVADRVSAALRNSL